MTAWFDRAFGPWYLKLYPHRDRAEAATAVGTLLPRLPARGRILDLACGPGRHLALLREAGLDAVGLDRSATLLAAAPRGLRSAGRLVRGDMRRLPFAGASFDAVLSMFTSFGYFQSRAAHAALLAEWARVVRPGGALALDYLNASRVRAELVPASERTVDGHRVLERRSIEPRGDGEAVLKELVILAPDGTEVERYHEEVALYDRDTVSALLEASGWRPEETLGDYAASPWSPASPRLLVLARRPGGER